MQKIIYNVREQQTIQSPNKLFPEVSENHVVLVYEKHIP